MRMFTKAITRLLAIALLAGALAGCKAELYSNLSEREANEMIAVLNGAGIEASREKVKGGTFTLSVDKDKTAASIAVLNQRGLPRQQFDSLANIFDAKKMVSTPFEERARFMHAMNQELANSLTQISGVVSARVHLMLPDNSPLDRNKQQPRASVFVYHQPNVNVSQHVPVIKNLIVNSVNGLNYEDVAVAIFPANLSGAISTAGMSSLPFGNQTVLIVLGIILVGMALFRRTIGRVLNQMLARS
jgi:type III secretion protein J